EHEVGSLAFEFRSKGAALFGHLTPRSGEHSRLNGCPVSLDHYILACQVAVSINGNKLRRQQIGVDNRQVACPPMRLT
ncbi:hypothetical protein, partial [Pseudomonas sp. A-RE-26]|uniref:hypothetical protein n=1 Tax=Pseudomonas sp. A-RE-26 TaxID=2832402 RepID=UPI001CBF9225